MRIFKILFNKNTKHKLCLLVFILVFAGANTNAQQYNIAGTAAPTTPSGCYTLTTTTGQAGAVWNIFKINLNQPFDITLSLNFGNRSNPHYDPPTCGADGMSFVLQPLSAGVFGAGSGVGYNGITPSLGVVMDTYVDNPTDPSYQHISIHKNGDELHNTANQLKSYTTAVGFPANITDGQYHLFRFNWIPSSGGNGTINVYFGTATVLPATPTITYTGNVINGIFSGDPNVYWGVSGSTGGCWNVQKVCMTTVSNFIADSTACAGQPITFTDQSITGLPVSAWVWDFGDGGSDFVQNPTHTYATGGTYSVSLGVYTMGGFYSTITHPIVIHPKPNVVVNDTAVCIGDTAKLTASGANTYQWNNALGSGAVKKVAPTITTSYIVTGTNSFGCTNKDTAIVTVNPKPIVTAISDTICEGDTAILQASGANTYLWNPGNFTSNPLHISPNVTTQYKVIGSNTFGCKDSTTANVVFYSNPVVNVNDATICLNDTATLTANGALSYSWNNNFSTSNPLKVSPPLTTTYYVTGEDVNNCIGKDSALVTVNNPPAISVDSAEICSGYSANLTVSGGSNLSYLWTNNGATSNPLNVSPTATTVYTVIATDNAGCKDTASGIVKVHPKPVASFLADPMVVNTDAPNVVFTDQSANAANWSWNFGDISSTANLSNLPSPTHTYSGGGSFVVWLVVSSDYGCKDSSYKTILVETPISFYIPNALVTTSINSEVNIFRPRGKGIDLKDYKMVIYNRWGQEIFSTTDFESGWNGKYQNTGDYVSPGVYVYYISYKEVSRQTRERVGSVTVIR